MEEEILKFLNENRGLDFRELIDLLIQKFPNDKEGDHNYIKTELNDLSEKNFVIFRTGDYKFLGDATNLEMIQNRCSLKKIKENKIANIEARITPDGRRELSDLEFKSALDKANKSAIKTNASIRRLNKRTWTTNIIGLVIAGLTGVFIAATFFRECSRDRQSTYIRSLPKVRLQDSTQLLQKKPPAPSLKRDSTKQISPLHRS